MPNHLALGLATGGVISKLHQPPILIDLVPDPISPNVGEAPLLFVILGNVALSNQIVTLSSDFPAIASVPVSVTVLAGQSVASFTLTALGEGAAIITATLGAQIVTSNVTVGPALGETKHFENLQVEVVTRVELVV